MPASQPPVPTDSQRTRQQLQELDALLQQMLSLPIAAEENERSQHPTAENAENADNAENPDPQLMVKDSLTATLDEAATKAIRPTPGQVKRLVPLQTNTPRVRPELRSSKVKAKAPLPLWPRSASEPSLQTERPEIPAAEHSPATPEPAEHMVLPLPHETGGSSPAAVGGQAFSPVETGGNACPPGATPVPSKDDILDPATFDLSGPASFDVSAEDCLGGASATLAEDLGVEPRRTCQRPGLIHLLLAKLDAFYDDAVGILGPVFTSPGFKNVLGWLGIVLLLAAIALTFGAWLGWTW